MKKMVKGFRLHEKQCASKGKRSELLLATTYQCTKARPNAEYSFFAKH